MLFIHLASAGWLKRRKVDWPRHNMQPSEKENARRAGKVGAALAPQRQQAHPRLQRATPTPPSVHKGCV